MQNRILAKAARTSRVVDIAVVVLGLATMPSAWAQSIKTNVVLGSSVAGGGGARAFSSSYAGLMIRMLATDGWWAVDRAVAGYNASNVIKTFSAKVPRGVDEVFIGLSLGNERLAGSKDPQAICNRFFSEISTLIAMTYSNGSLPLLGGVYPHNDFTWEDYRYLKNMVLRFNTLAVPCVNFLGATDDGRGHWVASLNSGDGVHPNDAGHYEMFLTIVPSVFDAWKAGKPTPQWGHSSRFVRIAGDPNQSAPLSFTPGSTVHSFSMSFRVRTSATGTVASVTLSGSARHPTIRIMPSGLVYVATNGEVVGSGVPVTDGTWHDVVVTHEFARGQTWFYVDGAAAGIVSERLAPIGFELGGRGSAATQPGSPAQADYRDWFIHRSMLNAEEVTAQHQGSLQQESLELYSPLDDPAFPQGGTVANRAQSLSAATIHGAMLSPSPAASSTEAPTHGVAPAGPGAPAAATRRM